MTRPRRRTMQRSLHWDCLEQRALLSGAAAHVHAQANHKLHNAHATALVSQPSVSSAADPPTTGSLAGLTVGPALSSSETQLLQQTASANNLDLFLTQLASLVSSSSNVQSNAQTVLTDARDIQLRLDDVAHMKGTVIPFDIMQSDQAAAKQVVGTVHTSNFDSTYLNALVQSEGQLVRMLQQQIPNVQDSDLKGTLQAVLTVLQTDLTQVQSIQSGSGTGTTSPPGTTPTSSTLSSGDLQTLETSYSTNVLEYFLGQLTALQTNNPDVMNYAEKLISDHGMAMDQEGDYAAATGTYLPASPTGSDPRIAQAVLAAVNTQNYDNVYLTQMVQSHTVDMATNQRVVNTTTNPTLKEFARDDIPTDWLHRAGAEFLLNTSLALGNFNGFANAGITNVKVRARHPGNGTLTYSVSFDANGYRFTQNYSMSVRQISRSHPGTFNMLNALTVFLQALYSRAQQFSNSSGTTSG